MANAKLDENSRPTLTAVSSSDSTVVVPLYADPTSHRLLVDLASGGGTVTSVSVVSANGFAGTVATATTTPAITLTTTITGLLKGNGTAISAATAGTDYVTASSTNTFTNKTYDTAGTGNAFSINGTAVTAVTGTGAVVLVTSATLISPALGTPTALVGTNITGTASGLTAGNVTTNANLTGAITSVGNATSLGSFSSASLAAAVTGETGTGALVFGTSPDFTTGLTLGGVAIPTISSTNTFTNKFITPQLQSVADAGGTFTPVALTNDMAIATALSQATTIAAPTGSPVQGENLVIRLKDNGTPRALTWNAIYRVVGQTLPTTTVTSKTVYVGCKYNSTDTKWDVLAVAQEA